MDSARRWLSLCRRIREAQHDPAFKSILNDADLVVPDGMPLVWLRLHGWPLARRVYGPELMLEMCRQTASRAYRHFLFGGMAGVADRLASALQHRFPGLVISGTCSPPFQPLTEVQEEDLLATIYLPPFALAVFNVFSVIYAVLS